MKKLLPLILLLLGTGAGVGAGVFLRPAADPETGAEDAAMAEANGDTAPKGESGHEAGNEEAAADAGHGTGGASAIVGKEYVKLTNQFVVPIVETDRIASMVVMSLSVEAPSGRAEYIIDIEPKIRDVFLRVLFDHAAIGGFRGAFLNNENLDIVRRGLVDAARTAFGSDLISDVLIFEIARQDY